MGPLVIVAMHPGRQGGVAQTGVGVRTLIRPLTQEGLDEAFRLAVGPGCVGAGALVHAGAATGRSW